MSCISSRPAWLHQLADALLQGGGDFFERQVQLQFLPGFFGLLVELANGLLRGQSGIVSS